MKNQKQLVNKLESENYLKSADCHVDLELIPVPMGYRTRCKESEIQSLFGIDFSVNFSNDTPPFFGEWSNQIKQHILNELEMFPHLGIPDDHRMQMCETDDGKGGLFIKLYCPRGNKQDRFKPSHMLVGKIAFSNRQFEGDPKKSFVI